MTLQFTSKQPPLTRRGITREAFALWCVLSIVYLSTLAGNHSEAEDALLYLSEIRGGDPAALFSPPYHLAYKWLAWSVYQVALALGYSGGPLLPVQVLNAFTGALGIALLWILLRAVAPEGRTVATAGCGLLAFSYGYWWYSVEVEVYILSAALLILSLFLAYRAAMRPSRTAFALLGGAHGLAILAHITNVLFVIVPLVSLLLAWRRLPVRRAWRCALAYAAVGISVVVPPYMLAIRVVGLKTPRQVYDWLAAYPQDGQWGVWGVSNVLKAVTGIGRALVGGHFAVSFDPVRNFVDNELSGQVMREEMFLVRNFNVVLATLLVVLTVVVVISLLARVIGWLRRPALGERSRVLALLCLSFLGPYVLFFVWWEPLNVEFWIAPWVALATLWALSFSVPENAHSSSGKAIVILVVALFSVNLAGSVWPQHHPEDDYWRVRASWYEENATPSDLIVVTGNSLSHYLTYFTPADVLNTDVAAVGYHDETTDALDELQRQIEASDAQRVLFSSSVFYPFADRFSLSSCPDASLGDKCENAAALRERFLPRTHVVSDEPLEEVRALDRR